MKEPIIAIWCFVVIYIVNKVVVSWGCGSYCCKILRSWWVSKQIVGHYSIYKHENYQKGNICEGTIDIDYNWRICKYTTKSHQTDENQNFNGEFVFDDYKKGRGTYFRQWEENGIKKSSWGDHFVMRQGKDLCVNWNNTNNSSLQQKQGSVIWEKIDR